MSTRHRRSRLLIWVGWPLLVALLVAGAFLYVWFVLEWSTIRVYSDPPYALWLNGIAVLLIPPLILEFVIWLRR